MTKRKQNKYYRIIEDKIRYPSKQLEKPSSELKDIITAITSNHKYIYIDINEQKGFKMMEECKEYDSQEEIEQVGNSFISNLNQSSGKNRKSITYLLHQKEINQQKELAFRLLDDQIKKSQLKIRKKKSFFMESVISSQSNKIQRQRIYHRMDPNLLEQYKNSYELDSIDHQIKQREEKLLSNYSIVPTQRSNQQQSEVSEKKLMKKKSLFPILTQSINTINLS